MSGIRDREDDDIVNEIGDRNSQEEKGQKEERGKDNNIITCATGTSTESQQGGTDNDEDMDGAGGGEDDDIVNGTGDGKGNEGKGNEGGQGNDGDRTNNNPTIPRVKIVDPKDMVRKTFTISHLSSTYPDYKGHEQVRKLTLEMQIKNHRLCFTHRINIRFLNLAQSTTLAKNFRNMNISSKNFFISSVIPNRPNTFS